METGRSRNAGGQAGSSTMLFQRFAARKLKETLYLRLRVVFNDHPLFLRGSPFKDRAICMNGPSLWARFQESV